MKVVEKQHYLLCVGRLEPQKGFKFAIKAFSELKSEFPNLRLKIVGKGKLEKELKQNAINYGVEDRVDFEGFIEDMIPYYLHAKATILTSLYEGYPNVLIESITLKTPVVAFDCPSGPKEIIENGINGYLVNNGDINDLKLKLKSILTNEIKIKDKDNTIKHNEVDHVYKLYKKMITSFDQFQK